MCERSGWRGIRLSVRGDRRKYKLIDDGGWPPLKGTSVYIPVPVIQDSLTRDVCGDQLGTYIIILGIENVYLVR